MLKRRRRFARQRFVVERDRASLKLNVIARVVINGSCEKCVEGILSLYRFDTCAQIQKRYRVGGREYEEHRNDLYLEGAFPPKSHLQLPQSLVLDVVLPMSESASRCLAAVKFNQTCEGGFGA